MQYLEKSGDALLVMLPEEIDHYYAPKLVKEIDEMILSQDVTCIIFDFANTRFMDSSGIGLLTGRYRKMQSLGGCIKVRNAAGHMAKILQLSGIEKIIGKIEETI